MIDYRKQGDEEDTHNEGDTALMRFVKRVVPSTPEYHETHLSVKIDGKRLFTPLFFVGATLGSAAVVLRYRGPRRDNDKPWIVPVMDARRMIQLVREHAKEWNADPKKVGILGFSAGGNLAARVAYSPAEADAARPDFAVMVYPAYLFVKDKPDSTLRDGPEGVIPPKGTKPVPAFFAHSADDPYPAEGSMAFAKTLKSMGGSTEVHVWAKGGHGWGAYERCEAAKKWTDLLGAWMKETGLLVP